MNMLASAIRHPDVPWQKYYNALFSESGKPGRDFLKGRGFKNKSTIQHFRLGFTETNEIAIPVFKDGTLVDYKFRNIERKEFRRHMGGETWVVNEAAFEYCKEDKYIILVEGEFDAMALYELGFRSVVSTTGGAQAATPWLDRVPEDVKIYICYDNDEPGQEAAAKIADRVGIEKCLNIVFKDCKDANDFLKAGGTKEQFLGLFHNAEKFKIYGIVNISEAINSLEKNKVQRVETFLPRLTHHLNGGVPRAGIITISGLPKRGKSSLLMNLVVNHAMAGIPTLLVSLENDLYFTVQRLLEIIMKKPYAALDKKDFETLRGILAELPLYLDVSLGNWDIKRIEKTVEQTKKLYGIEIFGFDHLSYLSGDEVKDIDNVVRRIKMMSRNLNIITYLVCHVRKLNENNDYPTSNDLRGSASIAQESNAIIFMQSSSSGSEINIDLSRMSRSNIKIPIMFDGMTGVITDDPNRDVMHFNEVVPDDLSERREIKLEQ